MDLVETKGDDAVDLDVFETRKLNVGCGFDVRPNYINIDLQSFHKPDIVANIIDISMIPSNWAEELVASDVLEHIGRRDTSTALFEWNRVLRRDGVLKIRTMYLPGLLKWMQKDWFGNVRSHMALINAAYSTQLYEGDYHTTSFTEKLMRFYVWACGFEMVDLSLQDEWLFVVEARKTTDYSFEDLIASASDEEFAVKLYYELLMRAPDEEGMQGKLRMLRSGESRRSILRGFLGSEERLEIMIDRAPKFDLVFDEV